MTRSLHCVLLLVLFLALNADVLRAFLLPAYMYYDYQRILELLIFAGITLALLCSRGLKNQWIETYQTLPKIAQVLIPLFFSLGFLSCFASKANSASYLWVAHLAVLFVSALYLTAIAKIHPPRFSKFVLGFLIFSLGYYILSEWMSYGIVQFLTHRYPHFVIDQDVLTEMLRFPGYGNPRFLSQVISWTLPLIVLPLLYCWEKRQYGLALFFFILATGWWEMYWLNQSRALYLEAFVTAILLSLIFRQSAKPYLLAQSLSALSGALLFILCFVISQLIPERSLVNFEEMDRIKLWEIAATLIKHHPWLGVGPLHYARYSGAYDVMHPHNSFLLFTSEWGIPAGLIFLGLAFAGLFAWTKKVRILSSSPNKFLLMGLTGSLFSGAMNAQVSGTLVMPMSQILFALIGGWALAEYQKSQSSTISLKITLLKTVLLRGVLLGLAGIVVWGVFPEVEYLPEETLQACIIATDSLHPTRCVLMPAYWGDHPAKE